MKKLVLTCLLAAVAAGAGAAGTPEQEAWLKTLLKEDGKVIKDATWMNERSLYIGVIDDGTRRDGLAQAVCEDAIKHGAELVKVVDVVIVARKGKFVELGRYWCKLRRS